MAVWVISYLIGDHQKSRAASQFDFPFQLVKIAKTGILEP
jgi:hypothetical protein